MAGKFLANDWGARFELGRKFESGLTITIWYTLTNGHDVINGSVYHDKGIAFTMPLDIFYTCYDRDYWHYGLAAWLRDVGLQLIQAGTSITSSKMNAGFHDRSCLPLSPSPRSQEVYLNDLFKL